MQLLRCSLFLAFICASFVTSQEEFINCRSNRLSFIRSNKTYKDFRYKSERDFSFDMCAQCYTFISYGLRLIKVDTPYGVQQVKPLTYAQTLTSGCLCDTREYYTRFYNESLLECDNKEFCFYPDHEQLVLQNDSQHKVFDGFHDVLAEESFIGCCREAVKCCDIMKESDQEPQDSNRCHAKWDAWDCWESAAAGETLTRTCPEPAVLSLKRKIDDCLKGDATKKCTSNGTWFQTKSGKETTDYSLCSFVGQKKSLREVHLRIALNVISMAFVVLSIGIFIGYKQYRLVRVKIHLNFFVALLLSSLSDLLFYSVVRTKHLDYESNILKENNGWCVFLAIFAKSAKLMSYCWMLCEGIYLHKLIVSAFHEQTRTWYFYVVGWVLPAVAMIPYIAVHSMEEYNNHCWTQGMGDLEWIHYPLPMICLIVNAVLLGNIVRVLCSKLSASPDHFKAAFKATLFLVPVFGIHYIFYVTKAKMSNDCQPFMNFLFNLGVAVDCLQGAMVSVIFCLLNVEIRTLIRRSIWRRFRVTEIVTEEHDLGKSESTQAR